MEQLPNYLFEHLLEALRRDMRREEVDAIRWADNADMKMYHAMNVRSNRAILECLRPKNRMR
jgi:hypothetical protein